MFGALTHMAAYLAWKLIDGSVLEIEVSTLIRVKLQSHSSCTQSSKNLISLQRTLADNSWVHTSLVSRP